MRVNSLSYHQVVPWPSRYRHTHSNREPLRAIYYSDARWHSSKESSVPAPLIGTKSTRAPIDLESGCIRNMLTISKDSTSASRLLVPACLLCHRLLFLFQAHSPLPPAPSHSPARRQGRPDPSLRWSRSGILPRNYAIYPRPGWSTCRLSIRCVSMSLAVSDHPNYLRCMGGAERVGRLEGRVARIAMPSLGSLLGLSKCIHLASLLVRR